MIAGILSGPSYITPAHAKACLGPAQQQKVIRSGKAKRFGIVARNVSKRLKGTVVNGKLCKHSGRLVYILTVINKKGQARRVVVDARRGR